MIKPVRRKTMKTFQFDVKPKFIPELDPGFRPAALENRAYLAALKNSADKTPLAIKLERGG